MKATSYRRSGRTTEPADRILATVCPLPLCSALQELMEGGDLRSRNRELDENGRRLFGWHQR